MKFYYVRCIRKNHVIIKQYNEATNELIATYKFRSEAKANEFIQRINIYVYDENEN